MSEQDLRKLLRSIKELLNISDVGEAPIKIQELQTENTKLRETLKYTREWFNEWLNDCRMETIIAVKRVIEAIDKALNPKPAAYISQDEDDGYPD